MDTLDRIEKELIHLHDKLIKAGLSSENVTDLAKKEKKILEKAGCEMANLLYPPYPVPTIPTIITIPTLPTLPYLHTHHTHYTPGI